MIAGRALLKEVVAHTAEGLGVPRRYCRLAKGAVRILTYHRFREGFRRDFAACLDIARFREHLDLLERDYAVVPLAAAVSLSQPGPSVGVASGKPPVAITVDDGFEDNYELAFPELRRRGLSATFFVVARFIQSGEVPWPSRLAAIIAGLGTLDLGDGQVLNVKNEAEADAARMMLFERLKAAEPEKRIGFLDALERRHGLEEARSRLRPMTRLQLREMAAAGMEIGSHTMHHSVLSAVRPDIAGSEIVEARDAIARMTGRTCRFLAYPDGKAGPEVKSMVQASGCEAAVTQEWGLNVGATDPFLLQRIEVPYYECSAVFSARVAGLLRPVGRRPNPGERANARECGAATTCR